MQRTARAAWEAARPGHDLPFDTACVAPWTALELDPAGWAYACCANQTYPLGRVGEQRLPELWASARMGVLRDALRRWDLSVGCQSCRWHLEHGRMDPDAAVYEGYPVAAAEPAGPMAMTFALSNRCNLGCVMCNPALSSTLRRQAGMPALVSPYDDAFFDDLAAFLPDLVYAKFLGGEPFLIPEHHRVWDLLEEGRGRPRIQVTTNGTVWTERVERVVSTFLTDITISMDGFTAATYEAIRRGSSHAEVVANVARFRAACAASGAQLRFCFCLMTGNWFELGAFLRWAEELGAPVSINVVSDTGLALHDLPLDQLDEVASTWAREDAACSRDLTINAEVWRTQLAQLDAVRAERRAGIAPPSKQPARVPPGFFAPADERPEVLASEDDVEAHLERMRAWCGGGPVAVLEVAPDQRIRTVRSPHDRLGLTASLQGSPIAALPEVMGQADGRPTWVLDVVPFADHVVRVIGLSTNPVRGHPGTIVRTVTVPRADGSVVLVAEDRILDAPDGVPATPVPEPGRRRAAPSPEPPFC